MSSLLRSKWSLFAVLVVLAAFVGCNVSAPPPAQVDATKAEYAQVDDDTVPLVTNPDIGDRSDKLKNMHRSVVQLFISRPNFGGGRILRTYPSVPEDVLHASSRNPRAKPGQQGFPLGQQAEPQAQMPEAAKGPSPHQAFQHQVYGLGLIHMFTGDGQETWNFKSVHLLGVVKNPNPVVYQTELAKAEKKDDPIPTRNLNSFEHRGLAKLRNGDSMYVEKSVDSKLRVLGPIFAGATCLKCHEKQGELLGAFTYVFNIGPVENKLKQEEVAP